jgi:DNA helicase-2/ATP-dependent DNA helicase PcrA
VEAVKRLVCSGEEPFAIYGFMGTWPELLQDPAAMPDVTDVALELNYCCGQDIVEASLQTLGQARTVRGENEGGETIIEAPADGPDSQRLRAVELVSRAKGRRRRL